MFTRDFQAMGRLGDVRETMSDAYCALDKTWHLIYVNGEAEKITHRSREELLGKIFWDAFPEIVATLFYEEHHLKTTDGIKVRAEFFCPILGVWLEVHAVSSPEGLAIFFHDITEQKKANADLKLLVERLFFKQASIERLLRHIPAGVMICEAPSGRILYENERIEKNFGHRIVPPNCIEEYAKWEGFHSDNRPYQAHEWPVARSILTGEVISGEEISIKRTDGKRMTLLVASAPIRNKAGDILAAMVIDHDITERKLLTDELQTRIRSEQEARRAAEAANTSKDEFIAALSHELRTPLTPVVMTLAAMERDTRLPIDARADVAMIRRNVELEMKLIDDLLDITRISHGKLRMEMGPVDIGSLLQNVLNIVRGDITAKGQHQTLELDAVDTLVSGDTARLHQVFWNLLKNAIKFTPEDGHVGIHTFNPRPGVLAVEISDSGEGLDAEAIPRIFAAFEQANHGIVRKFGGLELGLTISRAIMDLHGATIKIDSEGKGKGSCFTTEFPTIDPSEKVAEQIAGTLHEHEAASGARLLLVDDHQDTLRVLSRLLESLGYQVAGATSVSTALSYAAANPIDVLVSDIGLPDASGHDLMRQLKQLRNIPGVAVSGYGLESDVQHSYDAGFFAHLTKPINLHVLHMTIQRAIAKDAVLTN